MPTVIDDDGDERVLPARVVVDDDGDERVLPTKARVAKAPYFTPDAIALDRIIDSAGIPYEFAAVLAYIPHIGNTYPSQLAGLVRQAYHYHLYQMRTIRDRLTRMEKAS